MKDKRMKLLQQTTTTNDNEALVSIRMANKLLVSEGLHWNEFFNNEKVTVIKPITIRDKLNTCLGCQPYNTFLQSLNAFYSKRGFLSPKQKDALNKLYENL